MPEAEHRGGLAGETTSAADYFGALVAEYDSLIARAVPRYREMTRRLVHYLPGAVGDVLELGCGTGNLSLELAARHPRARLLLLDAAPVMADLALRRVRAAEPSVAAWSVAARFECLPFAPSRFDLVTSAISLHHVRDKGELYARILALLRPGGSFLFADQMAGATDRLHQLNWQAWLAFCARPHHCTREETQSLLEHAEAHDHYTSVPEHMALLARAGFVELDCVWRNWMWGILHARRPSQERLG